MQQEPIEPDSSQKPAVSASRLVLTLCTAEVLTMLGVFAFPALLPTFVAEWSLSNTRAGWIAGVYFAAYALAAPALLVLTDHFDARRVYIGGTGLAALSAVGFALFADGFWSALLFRSLAGASLAATYMPGLRVLVDRYRGERPSRSISFYTASFSLGTAASYFVAGGLAHWFGWRAAFAAAGIAAGIALLLAVTLAATKPPPRPAGHRKLDFRPVLSNRRAIAYILAYGAHCWELFTLRSWLVAFVALVAARDLGGLVEILSPTTVATLSGLFAVAASIGGNELALRFGRRRTISIIALASATMAAGIGFAVGLSYPVVVALMLIYTVAVQLDSASLTAGVAGVARPGLKGATLALHALFGFGCAGIGPVVFGVILDRAAGAGPILAWGIAFASVAAVAVLAVPAIRLAGDPQPPSRERG
ncbi:MAG: MFS transporter [Rhodospirillales bacterium]